MTEAPTKQRAHKVKERPELHPEAWEYSDGSVRRPGSHGSGAVFVRQPPYAALTITKETSPSLHQRKAELREVQRADYEAEAKRVLVSELARGKTPAAAGGKLVGMVAKELASEGAVKEHGLRGFTHAADWTLTQAGLIQESTKGTVINIDKQLNLDAGVAERVLRLLSPAGGVVSDVDTRRQQDSGDGTVAVLEREEDDTE